MTDAFFFSRRFLPLFLTQFLGALNDNILKSAMAVFILFRQGAKSGQIYATIAAGVFILPFILFSNIAGLLSDQIDKTRVIRAVKIIEVIIVLMAAIAFYSNSVFFLLFSLFLMGTHSAFFAPAKYSILPQHLSQKNLVRGNGFLSFGTFTAILTGTITGTLNITGKNGAGIITLLCFIFSVIGLASSFFIPPAPPHHLKTTLSLRRGFLEILKLVLSDQKIRQCSICLSWFWFLGATYLTQFPNIVKNVFHADETVMTLFFIVFTIGVALGSLLCGKILRGEISARLSPAAAAVITVFSADFYIAGKAYIPPAEILFGISGFLSYGFLSWRMMFDLLAVSIAGGVFCVPLYALSQQLAPLNSRASIMAGISQLNAALILLSSLVGMAILGLGFSGLEVIMAGVFSSIIMIWYSKIP